MAKKRDEDTFGAKLKKLREGEGLTLKELAEQVKMKPGYLSDLESGKVLPHVSEILTLSRTLSVDPYTFMGGRPAGASPGKRRKALATRTGDYAYETLTEEDPDRRLMGFRVTIEPRSDHRKVGYSHEGEEFIYVLSGKLRISVSGRSRTLSAGESIRFDSGLRHELKNPGTETTVLIVVIYTP